MLEGYGAGWKIQTVGKVFEILGVRKKMTPLGVRPRFVSIYSNLKSMIFTCVMSLDQTRYQDIDGATHRSKTHLRNGIILSEMSDIPWKS